MLTSSDSARPADASSPVYETPEALSKAWAELTEREPKLRIRDAAKRLGTTEAQLLATECGDGDVRRLRCEPKALLPELTKLGRVMVLTRNEAFVHEREGTFEDVSVDGHVGLVLGPDIDLRCFLSFWKSAFAVRKDSARGELNSLQFFDGQGNAVHKVYLRDQSDRAAYDTLVAAFMSDDQSKQLDVVPARKKPATIADEQVDVLGFRAAWMDMQDTHDFYGLLRKFKLSRTQSFRLAPEGHARQVPVDKFEELLEAASRSETPIMVFVGSAGCIQIHSGPVKRLKRLGDWFNVLDPDFNLHANTALIDSAWVVRKPTEDGIVTSLELFDAAGENLAMLFGARKPGIPELQDWRALVAAL